MPQGGDARHLAQNPEISITRLTLGLARDACETLARSLPLVLALAHPRLGAAAGEDRHRQLQRVGRVVRVVGTETGVAAREIDGARLVAVAAAGDEVELREMSAERRADVVAGDVSGEAARDEREVLLHRARHPLFLVGRVRALERHRIARLGERRIFLGGDLAQQLLVGGQLALRGDDGGGRAVARSLGFLHIGDGDQADLEALLGLLELARDRFERGVLRRDLVLGGEDVEVGFGDPQDQRLLGDCVVGLRLRDLSIGTLEVHPIRPGKDALPQVEAPTVGLRLGVARGDEIDDHAVAGTRGLLDLLRELAFGAVIGFAAARGARDLRQQCRQGLGLGFTGSQTQGIGLADLWVVGEGAFVDRLQVLRVGGGQRDKQTERQHQSALHKQGPRRGVIDKYNSWQMDGTVRRLVWTQ